jgi:hypothetical protein
MSNLTKSTVKDSYFSATKTVGDQVCLPLSGNTITLQTKQDDLKNEFNIATSFFIPQKNGVYLIIGEAAILSFAPSQIMQLTILSSVTPFATIWFQTPIALGTFYLQVSAIRNLVAGEKVRLHLTNASAADLWILNVPQTRLTIRKIM